jgi:predicted transcriptional regulator
MVRTQIYLTEEERDGLDAIAKSTGKKQSEIIREAVDRFIELRKGNRRAAILNDAAGMWRDRSDLPDFGAARRSWERCW